MDSQWSVRLTTLGELCHAGGGDIQTGPFGSQLHASDYVAIGIPSVMPQNIGDNVISEEGIARITKSDAARLSKYLLKAGDIVYSRRGDVEKRALVRPEQEGWLCGTGCLRARFGEEPACNPQFISYLLGTEESRSWIVRHAVGATMPNLNTSILAALPLPVPPPEEQNAIAEVLGALDDKIAANGKAACLVEDLLSAEFVQLGMDRDADDSVPLSSYFELNPAIPRPESPDPIYVDMQKLPTSGMTIAEWDRRPAKGGARFQNGDTLMARITPCLENRKTGFVDFLANGEVGLGSTEYIVIRSRDEIPPELSYFMATSDRFRTYAIRRMVGTSGRQRVSAADLVAYPVSAIGGDAISRFGQKSGPLVASLARGRDENRTLAALRDTLLPALMSGKLRVRDAEKSVEAVV